MIQIKNAKELDGMRKANALSAAALKYGGEHIEAGMTTWELDKLIYDFIVKHGGIPNFKGLYGFPGTACISLNDTIIHGIPSHDIVIRPGDIVSIDTGAKIDGFNGDNACTYAVGKVDLEAQRLLDVTKAALTPYSEFRKSSAESGIAFSGGGHETASVMLTACNSSRTTLRMLFSSLSVCSAARILCTRNSLRLAGGTCCNNAHARRCCGSLRFGRKTYCGRFIPRFCGATRRPTHARIRPRSPCRPAGKSSYKGRPL